MPAPFPLLKLGAVFIKQISKPIANFAKERAKSHPFFRTYVCIPPAQFYNWCEIKLKMWVLNLGKPVNIPVLNEQMAIELGANLLGEGIVFTIAAGVLIAEYNRSTNKEQAKEKARKDEVSHILYQLQELFFKVEQQDAQLREMYRHITDLESKQSVLGLFRGGGGGSSKGGPSKAPSAPVVIPISNNISSCESSIIEAPITQQEQQRQHVGLILRTVQNIQDEIFSYENNTEKPNSFITNALCYLEHEVYANHSIVVV